MSMPGIAFGMNTQGLGKYYSEDTLQRYDTKALGIYLAASKNWLSPFGNGNIGLHSGLNYSFLETNDGDEDLNLFFGLDLELNPEFSILLEYISALNENDMTAETMSISKGGYLNAAAFRYPPLLIDRVSSVISFSFNALLYSRRIENSGFSSRSNPKSKLRSSSPSFVSRKL